MTKCYQKLNFGWSNILNDIDFTLDLCKQSTGYQHRYDVPIDHLNLKFVDFLKTFDLDISKVHMFWTHIFYNTHKIHIDDDMPGEFAKLNWVYGDNDADMIWYKLKPRRSFTEMTGPNGYTHYTAEPHDVEEISRCKITANPTIVKTGILHTAVNHSGRDRFVCQLWLTKNNKTCTFTELTEIFKQYHIS